MRIVVTGGAGFIGSHLCVRLLAEGHHVVGVDNLITGRRTRVDTLARDYSFTFVEHNVSEPLYLDGVIDAVLHLASPASPVDYARFPIQTLKVGALGTWHSLGLAKEKGARFMLASTSEAYGDPQVSPQPETYWGHVNPIGPRGCYDEAKRYAEAITMAYHRVHELDTRIIRIFNTYGPHMRADDGRAIPEFITHALQNKPITIHGDGSQTRSFCYIDDMVEGIVRLLHHEDFHEPVNLGNPNETTVLELANLIKELAGSDSDLVYAPRPVDDPSVRNPDITRARSLLGWEPAVDLRSGLQKTIEYFRASLP